MKTMPNSTQEEKLRWIKPIIDKEISLKNMAKVCPFSKRSLSYWINNYKKYGVDRLQNKSTRPRSQPNETPIRIKERIIELRKETNLCAKKLKWKLEKEELVCNGDRSLLVGEFGFFTFSVFFLFSAPLYIFE